MGREKAATLMHMFPTFRKWFIPNADNAFQPHFFRVFSVILIIAVLLVAFAFSSTVSRMLVSGDNFFCSNRNLSAGRFN